MAKKIAAPTRNYDRNGGVVVDTNIPDDRWVVGAAVVLVNEAGEFSAFFTQEPPVFDRPTAAMPQDEVLLQLSVAICDAWTLASLRTTEEDN